MRGKLLQKMSLLACLLIITLVSVASAATTSNQVQVTLYMHEGSTYGDVIPGMQITGQDGNGVSFSKTTDSSGSISLSGAPGTWQFSASKTGYDSSSWSNYIVISKTLNGYLRKIPATATPTPSTIQVTLYMHDGSTYGDVIPGMQITGQDGNGVPFYKITDSTGAISLSGAPGTWQFSAVKDGYDAKSWSNYISISKTLEGYLKKIPVKTTTTQNTVQLTICVHETRSDGPVLSGVKITGVDGAGASFERVTDNTGTVVISGSPGIWSFSGSKDGYEPGTWGNNAYTTRRHDAYLQKSAASSTQTTTGESNIQVLLYIHHGSISGVGLSDVSISGSDGNGAVFSAITDSSGKIMLSGAPGTWKFSASKTGYDSSTWSNYITEAKSLNGYLTKTPVVVAQPVQNTAQIQRSTASEKPAQCIDVHQYISKEEMARYALDAGFDKENAVKIVAIAWAESTGDIFACPSNADDKGVIKSWDRGVLQINTFYRNPVDKNYIISDEQAFDPVEAFKGAYKIVNGKTTGATRGFYEWSAYESTNYYQALSGAREAVESIQSASTITFSTNPWNTGSISFSDNAYTSGQTGKYASKTYAISANVPSGYQFKSWSTTGGVSVSSVDSLSTMATVSGSGSLEAEYELTSLEQESAALGDHLVGAGSSQASSPEQVVVGTATSKYLTVPYFAQNDKIWSEDHLGRDEKNENVGSGNLSSYGCAVTSTAMVFNSYGVPTNPSHLNKWLQDQTDGKGFVYQKVPYPGKSEYDGINWIRAADIGKEYNVNIVYSTSEDYSNREADTTTISTYLTKGYPVIAQVHYTRTGWDHWVVITGYETVNGKTVYAINDPYLNPTLTPQSAQKIPDSRFNDYSKKGAEGTIKKIVVYQGPTTSTLPKENTQSQQSSSSKQSVESQQSAKLPTTVSESRPASLVLLDNFMAFFFPASKTQQPKVSTVQTATQPEQSTSSPEEKKNSGASQQSSTTTYYTPPGNPIPLSPGTEYEPGQKVYTTTPTFTWKADNKAQYYSLAISKSPYGSDNLVYNKQEITGSSIIIPENVLVAGEKYRWNMYAYNNAGRSAVSWTLYFTITK